MRPAGVVVVAAEEVGVCVGEVPLTAVGVEVVACGVGVCFSGTGSTLFRRGIVEDVTSVSSFTASAGGMATAGVFE